MAPVSLRSFSRSQLRETEVLEAATQGPVEIRMGRGQEPLLLLPHSRHVVAEELRQWTQTFLRVFVACRLDQPSPVLLAEFAALARLSPQDRSAILESFAEALDEAIRSNDLTPLRWLAETVQRLAEPVDSSKFSGSVDTEVVARLAGRLSPRE